MKRKLFLMLLVLSLGGVTVSRAQVKLLFDTDLGGDADELGTLVMLHNFIDRGECEVLGILLEKPLCHG